MLAFLRKLLTPPHFPDEDRTRRAAYLHVILLAAILLLVGLTLLRLSSLDWQLNPVDLALLALIGLLMVAFALMRTGAVSLAAFAVTFSAWLALTFMASRGDGARDSATVGYVIIILMSGLLLDHRFNFGFTALTILSLWGLAFLADRPPSTSSADHARDVSIVLVLIALLSYITITGLRTLLARTRLDSASLMERNQELENLRQDLEGRVAARTADLSQAAAREARRASQLRTLADIAQSIAGVKDLSALLPQVVATIGNRLGYYHVAIYLVDEERVFAELRAASSPGGRQMLAMQHRLKVGEKGIVGHVAGSGTVRIAQDVDQDQKYLNIPELPETRSEVGLPLVVRNDVIGVLDVQSTAAAAFDAGEVEILTALASQVAVAIDNARLFERTRSALARSEEAYREFVRQEWRRVQSRSNLVGYRFEKAQPEPILANAPAGSDENALRIPISLRGAELGEITIAPHGRSRPWTEEELGLLRATAERTALALENARLLESTRERAELERSITEMTTHIGASVDIDTILQTTAQELARLVHNSEIVVQLSTPRTGAAQG